MEHKIIVDARESRSTIIEALRKIEGLTIEVAMLDTGDFILHENVVVERKAASDFVLSIMDGRLFEQVGKMKLNFKTQIVVIEGDVFNQRSAMNPDAISAAISYLTVLQGVTVLNSKNAQETAMHLVNMSKHLHFGLPTEPVLRPGKPKANRDAVLFILQGLPGVGTKNASLLADHFGSIHKVMTATVDELCAVKGIGKGKAERIHEVVNFSLTAANT